jgi:c-di-GMP-binding flagellar brake protein YcgR
MDTLNKKVERRRFPRIKREIPLKIKLNDYDLVGKTQDISSIGIYCTVDRYVPPFSIISIILLLPSRQEDNSKVFSLRCQGAVVRSEKSSKNEKEYNIAIYFSRINQSDKTKLLNYVHQHL